MPTIKRSQSDWANYWKGREAGNSGEVFAGEGIENSSELSDFWARTFAEPQSGAILDIACGAGSAIKQAVASGAETFIGLDISAEALLATQNYVPGLCGVVASADALPFADGSIAHVFSQFGFEYSDRTKAAAEIARVLSDRGQFTAITHMKEGAIARECEGHLQRAQAITASGYVPAARGLFSAVFAYEASGSSQDKTDVDMAGKTFAEAQARLAPIIKAGGTARHLHDGASQLFQRRKAYLLEDIHGWLDQMAFEIEAYTGRMQGMLSAAIDREEAEAIVRTIAPNGQPGVEPFTLAGNEAAWVLTARP